MVGTADWVLEFSAALFGAATGLLFQRLASPRGAGHTAKIEGSPGAQITQGDTRITVRQTTTIQIANEIRSETSAKSARSRERATNDRPSKSDDDTWNELMVAVVVAVVAVALYLRYQRPILEIFTALAAFTVAFLLSALAWCRLNWVRLELSLAIHNGIAVILACALFADLYLLVNPVYRGPDDYRQIVALGRQEGLSVFLSEYGTDGFLFVLYQVFGLAAAMALVGVLGLHAARLLAAANLALQAKPRRLWAWIATRYKSWTAGVVLATVLTVVSLGMTSGVFYNLFLKPPKIAPPTQPSPTHAPRSPTPTRG